MWKRDSACSVKTTPCPLQRGGRRLLGWGVWLAACLAGLSGRASAVEVALQPASAQLSVGDVIQVEIAVQNHGTDEDVRGFSLNLSFNSQRIKITDAQGEPVTVLTPHPNFPNVIIGEVDNQNGILKYDAVNLERAHTAPVTAVTFFIAARASGTAQIGFDRSLVLLDSAGETEAGSSGATIQIAGPASDGTPPTSEVLALPAYTNRTDFAVRWFGQDNESGVGLFHVQFREGNDPWLDFPSAEGRFHKATTALFGPTSPVEVVSGRTYAFRVRARDKAGNWESFPNAPDAQTTVDALKPIASFTQPEEGALVSAAVEVEVVAFDGESDIKRLEIFAADKLVASLFNPPFKRSWDTTAFSDGEITLKVTATDLADNTTTLQRKVVIDNTPPAVEVTALSETVPSTSIELFWEGSDASGIKSYDVQVREGSGGAWRFVLQGSNQTSLSFAGEDGKTYFFRVRATDRAGNASLFREPDGDTFTRVDTAAPKLRFLKPASSVNAAVEVEFQVEATAAVSQAELFIEGKHVQTFSAPPFLFLWDTTAHGEGLVSLRAKAADAQGRTGEKEIRVFVDRTPPTASLTPLAQVTGEAPFKAAWSGADNAEVVSFDIEYRKNAGAWLPWLTGTTQNEALFGEGNQPPVEDGATYDFRARATDRAGNTGSFPDAPQATTRVVFDAPTVRLLTLQDRQFVGGKITVEFSASSNTEKIEFLVNDAVTEALTKSPWEFLWQTADFAETTAQDCPNPKDDQGRCFHRVAFRAISTQGKASQSGALTIFLDRTPPSPAVTAPGDSDEVTVSTLTFDVGWTADDQGSLGAGTATYDVWVRRYEREVPGELTLLLSATDKRRLSFRGENEATYGFQVRAVDKQGNVSPFSRERKVKVKAVSMAITPTTTSKILITVQSSDPNLVSPLVRVVQGGADATEATLVAAGPPAVYEAELKKGLDGPAKIIVGANDAVLAFTMATALPDKHVFFSSHDGRFSVLVNKGTVSQEQLFYLVARPSSKAAQRPASGPKPKGEELEIASSEYLLGPLGVALAADLPLQLFYTFPAVTGGKAAIYEVTDEGAVFLGNQTGDNLTFQASAAATGRFALFEDRTPPALAAVSPAEGERLASGAFTGRFTVSDGGAGVLAADISATIGETTFPVRLDGEEASFNVRGVNPGNHQLILKAKDRSGNEGELTVSFSVAESALSVVEHFPFPNPGAGAVTFRLVLSKISGVTASLQVYDARGRPIRGLGGFKEWACDEQAGNCDTTLILSGFPGGVYLYRVQATDGTTVARAAGKLAVLR